MDIKQIGTELLGILKQDLVSGSKMVSEQFPILCQQILRWGIVNNVCTILLSISMIIISILVAIFAMKKQIKARDEGEFWLFLSIPPIIVGIVFLITFWCAIFELGKILSAPNVFLLDYFKSLITPKTN